MFTWLAAHSGAVLRISINSGDARGTFDTFDLWPLWPKINRRPECFEVITSRVSNMVIPCLIAVDLSRGRIVTQRQVSVPLCPWHAELRGRRWLEGHSVGCILRQGQSNLTTTTQLSDYSDRNMSMMTWLAGCTAVPDFTNWIYQHYG